MIDHVVFNVGDLARAKTFYGAALAPLGYELLMSAEAGEFAPQAFAGFGRPPKPDFWISSTDDAVQPVHVAVAADDRAQVDAFYEAALAAGARDNGPPGIRAHYHPDYYGAFVLDPDGHNIEAVCHAPTGA